MEPKYPLRELDVESASGDGASSADDSDNPASIDTSTCSHPHGSDQIEPTLPDSAQAQSEYYCLRFGVLKPPIAPQKLPL